VSFAKMSFFKGASKTSIICVRENKMDVRFVFPSLKLVKKVSLIEQNSIWSL